MPQQPSTPVADGDYCVVVGGTHAGKSGRVEDRHTSKTGQVTITVEQDDGVRFKTLAKTSRAGRSFIGTVQARDQAGT